DGLVYTDFGGDLLERLAASVADVVLAEFDAVDAVTVSVDKSGALPSAGGVGVRIRRVRPA
ncbi:MAG: dihydroneopterin aldolase, partial [Planctomycetota bacterium]